MEGGRGWVGRREARNYELVPVETALASLCSVCGAFKVAPPGPGIQAAQCKFCSATFEARCGTFILKCVILLGFREIRVEASTAAPLELVFFTRQVKKVNPVYSGQSRFFVLTFCVVPMIRFL